MHNLKDIRKDFDGFKKALEKRSLDIDFEKLKDLDIRNREFIKKKKKLQKMKKRISQNQKIKLYLQNQKKFHYPLMKLQKNKKL